MLREWVLVFSAISPTDYLTCPIPVHLTHAAKTEQIDTTKMIGGTLSGRL